MKKLIIFFAVCYWPWLAYSAITIEITQSNSNALPIAIVPFQNENQVEIQGFSEIIERNLKNSGQFNLLESAKISDFPHSIQSANLSEWRSKGVEMIVVGKTQLNNGELNVKFELIDLYKAGRKTLMNYSKPAGHSNLTENRLLAQEFVVDLQKKRQLAHKISDLIYEKITGEKGVFSTKIVYVAVENKGPEIFEYRLEISDADGFNNRTLLLSSQPILSPDWSPDGKKLAYVSFENRRPEVFIQELISGKRLKIAGFQGINSAPAWSPDGTQLALAMSRDGNAEIYTYDIALNKFTRITHNTAIDTEPNWSPDGQKIIFTSDRGGSPQVYTYRLATRQTNRLTFDGKYNARARFTPDGSRIIMVHRINNKYHIATQDIETGALLVLTSTPSDESPSISPNGNMVLYATQYKDAGVLSAISMDGSVRLRLPSVRGQVKEPAWSPFFKG